jgi:hypothetical protein
MKLSDSRFRGRSFRKGGARIRDLRAKQDLTAEAKEAVEATPDPREWDDFDLYDSLEELAADLQEEEDMRREQERAFYATNGYRDSMYWE